MYNLRIIKSGDRIEIYKLNNYLIGEGEKHKGYKIIDELLEEDKKEKKSPGKQSKKDRGKTLREARNNIIRLIKSNPDMRAFITLTFSKEQDYKTSKKSLNLFFTKLRRDYKGLKYIWILEYGDRKKRLHYHLLCNIPITIKLSSSKKKKSEEHKRLEREFASRYWSYGFVDIRQLEEEGNTNIALYVSTYIIKSLQNLDLEGFRVYGYSRKTLEKPIELKEYTRDKLGEILERYKGYEITYSNSYPIGYRDQKGDHAGSVTYIDLKLKECRE